MNNGEIVVLISSTIDSMLRLLHRMVISAYFSYKGVLWLYISRNVCDLFIAIPLVFMLFTLRSYS
jgi:hypothetical protein